MATKTRRIEMRTDPDREEAGTARTYVWTKPGSPGVLAYYSIAPTQVAKTDVPRSLTDGYSTIAGYCWPGLPLTPVCRERVWVPSCSSTPWIASSRPPEPVAAS